jgi:phosphopantetheinyl transferase
VALRHLLGAAGATVHQACSFSCFATGKPYLPGGLEFSMSRSGNIALVAISPQLSVGVDIERIRPATADPPARLKSKTLGSTAKACDAARQ